MLEILGYFSALFMGIVLGSIGGGGSILTVPILVYLMGVNPVTATAYSLLIVGSVALFGAQRYYKQGLIDIKPAVIFALPSIISVYLTRAYIMPSLPDPLLITPVMISKDIAIMVLFAVLMIISAIMMIKDTQTIKPMKGDHHYLLVMIEGSVVGVVTGILGAGGGFLIIPALVLFMGMPMKRAIGASLLIIALKSLIGFIGDIQTGIDFQLPMLIYFFIATMLGMSVATNITEKITEHHLQKFFAFFTLFIATIIFIKELS